MRIRDCLCSLAAESNHGQAPPAHGFRLPAASRETVMRLHTPTLVQERGHERADYRTVTLVREVDAAAHDALPANSQRQ